MFVVHVNVSYVCLCMSVTCLNERKNYWFCECVLQKYGNLCNGMINYGGLTLAMVSWNLNSGSRVFGNSVENWASDRKLVAWGERDNKKQLSPMTPQQYLFNCHLLLCLFIISLRKLFISVGLLRVQSLSWKETKAYPFYLHSSYLFYSRLFYSILRAEKIGVTCQAFDRKQH